ncbi:MAG: hypothetical protein P4L28_12030 [Paludibacteraceae bacterium]|nr:hypothetical protein [Paludibacteraceae bacterium]
MKTIVRILFIIFLSLFFSSILTISLSDFFISTIFNVSGILFSVGLGLIVTFDINDVKNKSFIKEIRNNLNGVRNSFIFYFSLSVFCYIIDKYLRDNKIFVWNINIYDIYIKLNWSVLFCLLMFYSIFYFIINFLSIQKLKNDIVDKINE